MGPAALDDSKTLVFEKVGDGANEKIRGRDEIGVEDGNELLGSIFKGDLQGASLEPLPAPAAENLDLEVLGAVIRDQLIHDAGGLIVRVIDHEDLHPIDRVRLRHAGAGGDQPVNDIFLVENRQVDGDGRSICRWESGEFRGFIPAGSAEQIVVIKSIDQEVKVTIRENTKKTTWVNILTGPISN